MNHSFDELRSTYNEIIYRSYNVSFDGEEIKVSFNFEIPNLVSFNPSISFNKSIVTNKNVDDKLLNAIVFRIGLVELISYYKVCCPKNIILEAGYIDEEEQNWFKKLFYNGLGEFFYKNNIEVSEDELFTFINKGEKIVIDNVIYNGEGNLIPIGGGKDSIVTFELLKGFDNKTVTMNPKDEHYKCSNGVDLIAIKRNFDREKLMDLNSKGYLNGHIPFSAVVAFVTYLVAYLSNRKYIVLSNEGSANESTVIGTNINHQYSKSYEFERDFYDYTKKYFKIDINYFSLLRPIKEIQIAYLFSKLDNYHKIFKSCNLGSKENPWVWCCKCPKCLFVYIILRAFLPQDKLIDIFGTNMLDDKELENYFLELIGEAETKPFECVGTIDEVKYALNKIIEDNDNSYLVNLYKAKYYKVVDIDIHKLYYEHNVPKEYLNILKEAIENAK